MQLLLESITIQHVYFKEKNSNSEVNSEATTTEVKMVAMVFTRCRYIFKVKCILKITKRYD